MVINPPILLVPYMPHQKKVEVVLCYELGGTTEDDLKREEECLLRRLKEIVLCAVSSSFSYSWLISVDGDKNLPYRNMSYDSVSQLVDVGQDWRKHYEASA